MMIITSFVPRSRDYRASRAAYDASEIKRKFKVRFGDVPKPGCRGDRSPKPETYSLHIRVRAFPIFGDKHRIGM
jgi:hypothetical protein